MRQRFQTIIVLFSVISLCLPGPLLASEQTFNPNYLISDEEMQNAQSMNRGDIQAFLQYHNGYLSQYRTEDVSSTSRLASDIIYRAAQRYLINPKYLLVKLQKEQSLITDQDPTQKQLDWATGYGVCDSCSTSDPAIQKYKGFGTQVDYAAGIMRWYYSNVGKEPWIKTQNTAYSIDGTNVIPATLATAFLYTYTPHIHGNKNFWTLWSEWFAQVYPDGTLLKSSEEPTVYVLKDGKRRPFQNMTALITRFNPNLIITAPSSELARYDLGTPISLPNYAILKENSNYYLLDNDTLKPFSNESVVKSLGYHPDEIIEVAAADINSYAIGSQIDAQTKSPLGQLLRIKENNSLYYVIDETMHLVSQPVIAQINFPTLRSTTTTISSLAGLTMGAPVLLKDGTLFGVENHNEIYVVEHGKKRHITSEEVFNGMGYDWKNIVWIDELTGLQHPSGQALYLQRPLQVANTQTTSSLDAAPSANSLMVRTPLEQTTYVGPQYPSPLDAYLVADFSTGEVIAGKNIDIQRPLASLTKVMTGYRLLQEGLNENRYVTYDPKKHQALYHRYRVVAGEKIRNADLFDAMLVSSLNTPARMLVSSVTGDEAAFITRMNDQAKKWGLQKTAFSDVSGVNLENVTTAREYAKLYKETTRLGMLKQTLGKSSYEYSEVYDIDKKPDHFDEHTNELMSRSDLPFTIISSKTGYLDESGSHLVMHVQRKKDQKEFLILTMGNPNVTDKFSDPEAFALWASETF